MHDSEMVPGEAWSSLCRVLCTEPEMPQRFGRVGIPVSYSPPDSAQEGTWPSSELWVQPVAEMGQLSGPRRGIEQVYASQVSGDNSLIRISLLMALLSTL